MSLIFVCSKFTSGDSSSSLSETRERITLYRFPFVNYPNWKSKAEDSAHIHISKRPWMFVSGVGIEISKSKCPSWDARALVVYEAVRY